MLAIFNLLSNFETIIESIVAVPKERVHAGNKSVEWWKIGGKYKEGFEEHKK